MCHDTYIHPTDNAQQTKCRQLKTERTEKEKKNKKRNTEWNKLLKNVTFSKGYGIFFRNLKVNLSIIFEIDGLA